MNRRMRLGAALVAVTTLALAGSGGGSAANGGPLPTGSIAVASGGSVTVYSDVGTRLGRLKLPVLSGVQSRVQYVGHAPEGLFAAGWPYLLLYTGLGDQSAPVRIDDELAALTGVADTPEVVTAIAPVQAGELYAAFSDGQFVHEIPRYRRVDVGGRQMGLSARRAGILVPERVTAMDVDAAGCVLVYGTATGLIRFLDECRRTQLMPLSTTTPVSLLRIAPGQTLLVASESGPIRQLGADASVRRTFTAPGVARWTALDLTVDGSAFWAADPVGVLYRFDLSSGAVTGRFDTGAPVSSLAVVGARRYEAPAPTGPPPPQQLALDGVPTLTGEGLAGLSVAPSTLTGSCAPAAESVLPIATSGATIGPYGSSFRTALEARVGPQTLSGTSFPLGLQPGPVRGLTGTFSISGGAAEVEGSLAPGAPEAANTGICAAFTNQTFPIGSVSGFFRSLQAPRLAYEARITVRGRTYRDSGTVGAYFTEYHMRHQDGRNAGEQHVLRASFASSQISVDDPFRGGGQSRAHTAAIPAATPTLRITLRWRGARNRFSLANVRFVQTGRSLAMASKLRPGGVDLRVRRTKSGLNATVSKLRPGRLAFSVRPDRLRGATTVSTAVAAGSR